MDIKNKLMKTRKGIPALALILLVVLVGTATATGYLVYQDMETAGINESVSINKKKGLGSSFWPNQHIGSVDGCAKYMIINDAPIDQKITVDIVESESTIDELCSWYGIMVVPSQDSWAPESQASYDLGTGSTKPDDVVHSYTFNIGSVEYATGGSTMPTEDSSYWRVFVDGKLKSDVDPNEDIKVKIKVFRG